jgi:hypothetical protein
MAEALANQIRSIAHRLGRPYSKAFVVRSALKSGEPRLRGQSRGNHSSHLPVGEKNSSPTMKCPADSSEGLQYTMRP